MSVSSALPPPNSIRLCCPSCGRYLGTVNATYAEYPPCACGFQTTVRVVGKRARRLIEMPGGAPFEIKAH